jgi:hypothetical protein
MWQLVESKEQEDKIMGGSGGGYFSSDINKLKNKLERTEKSIANDEYRSNVANLLSELLSQYNDRDANAINTHLAEILKAVENRVDEHLDILLGGSVSKHTYVDSISDIDTLIILNDTKLQNKAPNDIKKAIADMLRERFPHTDISLGKLAITVSFKDCEIQILPALKSGKKIIIPDESGNNWAKIDPKNFVKTLTKVNADNGNKLIPVIKLAKAIVNKLPEKQRLSGYHVEALAVNAFVDYQGERTPQAMLKYFFHEISNKVLSPIVDKTGQSIYIDEYLGNKDSLQRQLASSALDRVYRKLQNADNSCSLETWEDIFK